MSSDTGALDDLLHEDRRFPPPNDFAAGAVLSDPGIYERASSDPELTGRMGGELDGLTVAYCTRVTPHTRSGSGAAHVSHNCSIARAAGR